MDMLLKEGSADKWYILITEKSENTDKQKKKKETHPYFQLTRNMLLF